MFGRCKYCEHPVDVDDPTTWSRVSAWVHGPKQDGARLRERLGEYMHDECMKKYVDGISSDMEAMDI